MRRSLPFLLAASALVGVAGHVAVASAADSDMAGPTRAFTGEDLFSLAGATDPQISPDGSRVAYVRMSADVMLDKEIATIWLVDLASGRQTPLVAGQGTHRSPRWSPDGKRLAYVSSQGEGAPQLNVMWLDSGRSVKVTGMPDSPGSLAWSPDGRSIAYTMRVPGEAMKLGKAPEKPEGAKWAEGLQVIDRVAYRADGGGYAQPGYDHVFVVPADGGATAAGDVRQLG